MCSSVNMHLKFNKNKHQTRKFNNGTSTTQFHVIVFSFIWLHIRLNIEEMEVSFCIREVCNFFNRVDEEHCEN